MNTLAYLEQPGLEFTVQNDVKAKDLEADTVAPWWLAGTTHAISVQHVGLCYNQRLHHELLVGHTQKDWSEIYFRLFVHSSLKLKS